MKRKKQNRHNKSLWSKKEMRVIKISGFILCLGVLGLVGSLIWQDLKKQQQLEQLSGTEIKNSRVCMAGNNIKFNELKVTVIDTNKYWICCVKCEAKLKQSPKMRFARDPVTNKIIDKSTAVIMQDPIRRDKVLYFETKRSFDVFKSEY